MVRALIVVLAVLALILQSTAASEPAIAATCADYTNQAAAQAAGDTRDADGDGIYWEALPCPCSKARPGSQPTQSEPAAGDDSAPCSRPRDVQNISFSATKYPNIRRHFLRALRRGWPRTLVLNRPGADARRDLLLSSHPTRPGEDRDEYPPTVGRGKGQGLQRGEHPRGWRADVQYVPSSGEPLPRLHIGHETTALLQRNALSLRGLLTRRAARP